MPPYSTVASELSGCPLGVAVARRGTAPSAAPPRSRPPSGGPSHPAAAPRQRRTPHALLVDAVDDDVVWADSGRLPEQLAQPEHASPTGATDLDCISTDLGRRGARSWPTSRLSRRASPPSWALAPATRHACADSPRRNAAPSAPLLLRCSSRGTPCPPPPATPGRRRGCPHTSPSAGRQRARKSRGWCRHGAR